MNQQECLEAGIDYDEGVARFVGNAQMYERFLKEFLSDPTFDALAEAMERRDIPAAFAAAHTLKGLTGNLSLDRLYEKLVTLTNALRGGGDLPLAESLFPAVRDDYRQVKAFIAARV